MSTEPTPAIQQNPEGPTCPGCKTVVSYVQWSCVSPHDGTIWHLVCAGLHVESTRNAVLAAALDVEEMRAAIVAALQPDEELAESGIPRRAAEAIRAALLGEEAKTDA